MESTQSTRNRDRSSNSNRPSNSPQNDPLNDPPEQGITYAQKGYITALVVVGTGALLYALLKPLFKA